jgi:hypothetical protein
MRKLKLNNKEFDQNVANEKRDLVAQYFGPDI